MGTRPWPNMGQPRVCGFTKPFLGSGPRAGKVKPRGDERTADGGNDAARVLEDFGADIDVFDKRPKCTTTKGWKGNIIGPKRDFRRSFKPKVNWIGTFADFHKGLQSLCNAFEILFFPREKSSTSLGADHALLYVQDCRL